MYCSEVIAQTCGSTEAQVATTLWLILKFIKLPVPAKQSWFNNNSSELYKNVLVYLFA